MKGLGLQDSVPGCGNLPSQQKQKVGDSKGECVFSFAYFEFEMPKGNLNGEL